LNSQSLYHLRWGIKENYKCLKQWLEIENFCRKVSALSSTGFLCQNNRKAVYATAYAKNPKRWSGNTRNWQRIEKVHLNPDKAKEGDAKNRNSQTRKVA
jgi:hypothetical protein